MCQGGHKNELTILSPFTEEEYCIFEIFYSKILANLAINTLRFIARIDISTSLKKKLVFT